MEINDGFYQSYMADNYDRMSGTYDKSMDYKWFEDNDPRYVFENLVKKAVENSQDSKYSALDVGTGTGRIALMVAQQFPQVEVVGLDQSRQMIDVAQGKMEELGLSNVSFDNYSVETKLGYDDGVFNLVTCSLAMIYFTQKAEFIKETRRVLKSKGTCLISTIGPADMESVLKPFWDLYYKFNPSFKNTFNPKLTEDELSKLFTDAGYDDVQITSFKENVIFGTLDDYMALFNTYGLSGLLFFLPKSAAIELMDQYKELLQRMCEGDGRLVVLREVLIAKGTIN